jgi:hypothetical protein
VVREKPGLMDKQLIYNPTSQNLIIIFSNGTTNQINEVSREAYETMKEEDADILFAMWNKESNIIEDSKEKVSKTDWINFVEQERDKVINKFQRDPKNYFIYEDEKGITKLALDTLIKTKFFQSKNNKVLGSLEDLYNEVISGMVKNRIINI